jgi:hypothetical protein
MSTPVTIEGVLDIRRRSHGRRVITPRNPTGPPTPPLPPPGRLPRVTRLVALAHRLEAYLRDGVAANAADLARLGYVSRARISQILNLLNLAPDIQEQLLFLLRAPGPAPILLAQLQPIASTLDWETQRRMWDSRPSTSPIVLDGGTKGGGDRLEPRRGGGWA